MKESNLVKLGSLPSDGIVEIVEEYDVETKKSSNVSLFPERGTLRKRKVRNFDSAVYEAFMMYVWKGVLSEYSKGLGFSLQSPEFQGLEYNFESRVSDLYMTYCAGMGMNKLDNGKRDKAVLKGKHVRISSLASFFAGVLGRIKEIEGLHHNDYSLRHLLFRYHPGDDSVLSVIDIENSHVLKESQAIADENGNLEMTLFQRFNCRETRNLYHAGREMVQPLEIVRSKVILAREEFKDKIGYYVDVDVETGKIEYPK